MERVGFGKWDNSGPVIENYAIVKEAAQDEWDHCVKLAEEAGVAHLIDPVCLRDHCLVVANSGDPDPNVAARRAMWDIRSVPIKRGACCAGAADETYVPA
jgi:hypothetical protein